MKVTEQVHSDKQRQDNSPARSSVPQLTRIASALIVTFIATCAAMHIAQPELNPVDDAVSFYMNGRLGWLISFGIVALGAGSLLIVSVQHSMGGGVSRPGLILLGTWGVGCIIAGIFPPDAPGHWDRPPSFSGAMHSGAAMLVFISFPVGALLISRLNRILAGPGRCSLKAIAALCALATIIFFGCLAPVLKNGPSYALGLSERVVLGLNIWWLLAANRRTRSAALAEGS